MVSTLVLTDYFPPHTGGGVERVVYEVSRRIAQMGHRVTVLTLNTRRAPATEEMDGIEVIRVPGFDLTRALHAQVAVSPQAWIRLRRLLQERDFDLVHAHNVFFHLSLAGAFLAERRHTPLITTAHLGSAAELGGAVSLLTNVYERTLGRAILRRSSRTIAVSRAVAGHLESLGVNPKAISVIPNGVDLQEFRPAACSGDGPPTVLFVGRMIFNKGPQFLVDVLPGLAQRFPETRFRFIGDGPLRARMEERVREQGLASRVEFLGQREDVAELLRHGTILVRPSLLEGLPLTALEGMASALPVVATRVGGTPEVIGDGVNGFLTAPGDNAELAERLSSLLADSSLREQMGRAGRRMAEQGFDWDDVAARTVEVYEETLGRTLVPGRLVPAHAA